MKLADYDAVIFDMDGVIFDSERAVKKCWMAVAPKYSIPDIEATLMECIGTNSIRTKEIMCCHYGSDFAYEAFIAEVSAMYHSQYDGGRLPMKPGVNELLDYLRSQGTRIALASSSAQTTVINQLRDAHILSYFDAVICGDMVQKSKPAPDIFIKACKELSVCPNRCYGIEDSYNGIRALYAGGLHPIMVPDLLMPTPEMTELSEVILSSLLEVKRYLSNQVS